MTLNAHSNPALRMSSPMLSPNVQIQLVFHVSEIDHRAANVVTASEAREPDAYRDSSNRLLDSLDSYSKCNKPPDRTPQRS